MEGTKARRETNIEIESHTTRRDTTACTGFYGKKGARYGGKRFKIEDAKN